MDEFPDIFCKRCGSKVPTLNPLRKWCADCRHVLTNERARLRNKHYRMENRNQG